MASAFNIAVVFFQLAFVVRTDAALEDAELCVLEEAEQQVEGSDILLLQLGSQLRNSIPDALAGRLDEEAEDREGPVEADFEAEEAVGFSEEEIRLAEENHDLISLDATPGDGGPSDWLQPEEKGETVEQHVEEALANGHGNDPALRVHGLEGELDEVVQADVVEELNELPSDIEGEELNEFAGHHKHHHHHGHHHGHHNHHHTHMQKLHLAKGKHQPPANASAPNATSKAADPMAAKKAKSPCGGGGNFC